MHLSSCLKTQCIQLPHAPASQLELLSLIHLPLCDGLYPPTRSQINPSFPRLLLQIVMATRKVTDTEGKELLKRRWPKLQDLGKALTLLCTILIPALRKARQEDQELEASLGCSETLWEEGRDGWMDGRMDRDGDREKRRCVVV